MHADRIPVAAVAILNFNGSKLLGEYLPPLLANTPAETEIYVIDNGSTDDSLELLVRFSPRVKVIRLSKNSGFADGYNQGLKSVKAKYIALMNSDVLIGQDWLSPIIHFMEADERVGVCQPKILSARKPAYFEYAGAAGGFIDSFGYPFCRGRIFSHIEEDTGQYDTALQIFWASGAAFVIRSDLFHLLGGFDGDFFAHMEEIDLCWRVQRLGYKIYCFPESKVYHLGGGTLTYGSPGKTYLNFRNGLSTLLKNLPARQLAFRLLIRMGMDGAAGLQFLLQGHFSHFVAILKAHFSFYNHLSRNIRKRKELEKLYKVYAGATPTVYGIFRGSIVWAYFIRKRSSFNEIKRNIK